MALSNQIVKQTKAGWPGFVYKRDPLIREMPPHVIEQMFRVIGHAQRSLRLPPISERRNYAPFINI